MKTKKIVLIFLLCITILSGCAYVNIKIPLDINLENTQLGSKVGSASNYSILWLVAWGDGSYEAAAKNGDIKILKHSDISIYQLLLGIYTKRTVIVYGD